MDAQADGWRHLLTSAAAAADRSFESAVAAERSAIVAHHRAAALHRDLADRLQIAACEETVHDRRERLLGLVEAVLSRATAAEERAARARARLVAEGVVVE